MRRSVFAIALAAGVCAALAGCGKAGRPLGPPGSDFPRQYPSDDLRPKTALPPEWDQDDMKQAYPNGQPKSGGPTPAKSRYIDQDAVNAPQRTAPTVVGPRGSVNTTGGSAGQLSGTTTPGTITTPATTQQTAPDSQQ